MGTVARMLLSGWLFTSILSSLAVTTLGQLTLEIPSSITSPEFAAMASAGLGLAAVVGLGVLAVKNSRRLKQRHISNGPYFIIKNKATNKPGHWLENLGQPRQYGFGSQISNGYAVRGKREAGRKFLDDSRFLHVSLD